MSDIGRKTTVTTYAFILLAMLLSKALGLLRDMMLANYYGTGPQAAAFSTASSLPLIFFDITLGSAIGSAFIPVLNEYLGGGDEKRAQEYTDRFLSVVLLISGAVALLGILFSGAVVKLAAPGLESATSALASLLLKIIFPVVVIASAAYTVVGFLQSRGRFKIPAVMSALSNLTLIFYFLFLNGRFGIRGLAFALTAGWGFQLLILLPSLAKTGYRYRFALDVKDEGVKKSAALMLPVLISSWAQPINTLIGINVSSFVGGGQAVSVLNYAYKIYLIVAGVFAFALTNIYFPRLSLLNAQGEEKKAGGILKGLLASIFLITAPVAVFFMLFSKEIVTVVYARGEFTPEAVAMTAPALFFYSLGMIGFSFQEVLNKYYYSKKDSKTPMRAALFAILLNIALSALLAFFTKKIAFVALASAVSITLSAAVLLIKARKSVGRECFSGLFLTMAKSAAAAAISGAAMRLLYGLLPIKAPGAVALFFLCAGIFVFGAAIYAVLLMLFRVGELKELYFSIWGGRT